MKVFISWSGERSKAVGELLDEWLQCVLQAIDPWMSSKDIDRGSLWFSEITDQLKDTTIGIVCLTKANKDKPWILFEAGALAKGLTSNRVCTFLIDLQPTDIEDPLAQFNHSFPNKDGLWNLIRTLNSSLGEDALKEKILERVFDTYWPQFEEDYKKILESTPETVQIIKRKSDDILLELLSVTRNLDKKVRNLENSKSQNYESKRTKFRRITRDEADLLIKDMVEQGLPDNVILDIMEETAPVPKSFVYDQIEYYKRKLEDTDEVS